MHESSLDQEKIFLKHIADSSARSIPQHVVVSAHNHANSNGTTNSQNNNSGNKVPTAEDGSVIIKITPQVSNGRAIITDSSIQSMPIDNGSYMGQDPLDVPLLKDFSAGTIDLDENWIGGSKGQSPFLVEGYPTLPFITRSYNRRQIISMMTDEEIFIRNWKIKRIDPQQFGMRGPNAWHTLPYPAPVFVNVPKFGVGVVRYFRWGNTPKLPILYYAVWKLTPLGVFDGDPYVGSWYEIFATWVKPMKMAVSQYWPSYNSLLMLQDDGYEFQWTIEAFKNSQKKRVIRAKNALVRSYDFLAASLLIHRGQVPPELVMESAEHAAMVAAKRSITFAKPHPAPQYHQPPLGGGRLPPWASQIPSTVSQQLEANGITNLSAIGPSAPPAASLKKAQDAINSSEEVDTDNDDEDEENPPVTKNSKAKLNLGNCTEIKLITSKYSGFFIDK